MPVRQERSEDGRYDYGDMDRVCVCGHTLGDHAGGPNPKRCLAHANGSVPRTDADPDCQCEKFRPKRTKAKRRNNS
jgi:hypothetical protein